MPVLITVHPSAQTSVRLVHTATEPPSLVIRDGTTTVVFSPADLADGVADAAEFAPELVQAVSEWESGCRRTAPKPTNRRNALAAARVAAGFSQEALAARVGVERSTVYRWEAGLTTPLPMLRPGLAQLLGLNDKQLATALDEHR